MQSINRNSLAYFMGFNAFTLKRPKNPFVFGAQAAKDWLSGFVTAQETARESASK